MLKEIVEVSKKVGCFVGLKKTDTVVHSKKGNYIYGVFDEIEFYSEKTDSMLDEYDFDNIEDLVWDMDHEWELEDEDISFCKNVNKWVKQFGIQKNFISFEPDSKHQKYMKF